MESEWDSNPNLSLMHENDLVSDVHTNHSISRKKTLQSQNPHPLWQPRNKQEQHDDNMCGPTNTQTTTTLVNGTPRETFKDRTSMKEGIIEAVPSEMACNLSMAAIVLVIGVWYQLVFKTEDETPGVYTSLHSIYVPIGLSACYLVSLDPVRRLSERYLWSKTDPNKTYAKVLLFRALTVYNLFQVLFNVWMVYTFVVALAFRGHHVYGDTTVVDSGAPLAIWYHYTGKYIEFVDTYAMLLRGNIKQFSFLHVIHHAMMPTVWWWALRYCPGGDSYFGALLNSFIHVLMYSVYVLSLWKIRVPKQWLTVAQMLQFVLVMGYTVVSYRLLPDDVDNGVKSCYRVQFSVMVFLLILFLDFFLKRFYGIDARKATEVIVKELTTEDITTATTTGKESKSSEEVPSAEFSIEDEQQSLSSLSTDEQHE